MTSARGRDPNPDDPGRQVSRREEIPEREGALRLVPVAGPAIMGPMGVVRSAASPSRPSLVARVLTTLGTLGTLGALGVLTPGLAVAGPAEGAGECHVVGVAFKPESRVDLSPGRNMPPQIVVWLEDPAGNYVDTIFITRETGTYGLGNRPGRFDFNSGPMWPYGRRITVFPVWASARRPPTGCRWCSTRSCSRTTTTTTCRTRSTRARATRTTAGRCSRSRCTGMR